MKTIYSSCSDHALHSVPSSSRGSILIIVLWIATGLVSITLLFGHSMFFEFKAADNYYAGRQAEQAIEGGIRYIQYMLANQEQIGVIPDKESYLTEAVPVGDALFWIIGRESSGLQGDSPSFGLVPESSRINLNSAPLETLELIPGMTLQLAASLVDWRDEDEEITPDGAESETYVFQSPPYLCKNAPFETVDEVRLVFGAYIDGLLGEDTNFNGFLDLHENDREISFPVDNQDGYLDTGLLEYFSVWSRDLNLRTDGSPRVNVYGDSRDELNEVLANALGQSRADEITGSSGDNDSGPERGSNNGNDSNGGGSQGGNGGQQGNAPVGGSNNQNEDDGGDGQDDEETGSLLEYYLQSGMTQEEFDLVAPDLTTTDESYIEGLINTNTASEQVLSTVPGIDEGQASSLVAYRMSSVTPSQSIAWILDVLDEESAIEAASFLTTYSYQYSVDIAAVGRNGRGYRRVRFVLSFNEDGKPEIVYRKDMTRMGWALGPEIRRQLDLLNDQQYRQI